MTPIRTVFSLILLAALLLAAGCESESPSDAAPASTTATHTLTKISTRHVTTTIPPAVTLRNEPEPVPVTGIIQESESRSQGTVSPLGNYHPEYIKMDATVYTPGEVVQFYLVNKGPEITGCDYSHPPYTIFHLSPDGTRLKVSSNDPNRSYNMVISEGEPGSATGPFSLDTRRLSPGRYLIRFDCGNNVARDFVIQARAAQIISP
jgi:hypothetical protein